MSEIVELERPSPSVQTALLKSLENDDFEEFKRILQRLEIREFHTSNCPRANAIDINHLYDDRENKTLLDIACSSTNKAAFVEYLLQHGADVNLINHTHGVAPIHLAVSNSDFDTVKLLVEHKDIDIHQPNTAGLTAFHLAAQRKQTDFIKLLQGRQAFEIEQAKMKVRMNKTSLATYKYNAHDLANSLQTLKMNESENDQSLSSLLKRRNYQAFKSEANADNVRLVDDSLEFTYLQYACKFGLIEFVELLLDLNVDPNQTGSNRMTPIILAAYEGYYEIVQLLQNTGIITYDPVYKKNILHFILNGYEYLVKCMAEVASTEVDMTDGGKKDYAKCLKLILDNVPHHQLDVDEWDKRGNTPLHYAIVYDNRDMILSLIQRGAYIGAPNQHGDLPITLIKPATLEYLLDESMWTTISENHYNRTVFNYDWLTRAERPFNREQIDEIHLLKALSEVSKLRPLLKHPFFLVLLDFKWHIAVRKFTYIDLSFYIQFVVLLSLYILTGFISALKPLTAFARNLVIMGNTFKLLKELTQFTVYSKAKKYAYVTNPKNYMEITLIIIIYALFLGEIRSFQIRYILAYASIFLSYLEVVLLIINHPFMSVQIEMFKVVAWNTFKFLMSFVILILAFAFTFFLLFKDIKSTKDSFNSFGGILNATFKTLIMSTGEYEITNTLTDYNHTIGYLVFILFIFFVPIVLFNLLNAIAVSDIQGIRKEAELVSTVALVQLTADTEEIISTYLSFLDLLVQLANYCIHYATCRRQSRNTTWEKQYYYTNYFSKITNCREVIYKAKFGERGTITRRTFDDNLVFVVSPSTQRSIREKIAAKTRKKEKADVSRVSATSPEVCKSLITLMNALDGKSRIIEPILTEITKLSNQESK